jgi:hypothetical protein
MQPEARFLNSHERNIESDGTRGSTRPQFHCKIVEHTTLKRAFLSGLLFMSSVSAEGNWSVTQAVPAAYPPLALHAEIQGSVELKCGIGVEGNVTACIAVSGHPLLRAPAIENAKRWHFEQVRDAAPQPTEFVLVYEFVLREGPPSQNPKVDFSFQHPNRARIVASRQCADHAPCTPDEWKEFRKTQRKKSKDSIP